MDKHPNDDNAQRPCWFVGATFHGRADDQTARFLKEGIWENGYDDKYQDLVREMREGDRIAIKSTYKRKHGLPFDTHGHNVSVMGIKAIGTITENGNDGKRVWVDWTELARPREYFFHTYRKTVWRVFPGEWMKDDLIAFSFEGKLQDTTRFRNDPSLRDRFGDRLEERRFLWTLFYKAIAKELLSYRDNRSALMEGIHDIESRVDHLSYLKDADSEGGDPYPLRDICPFTTMGTFNRSLKDENRRGIAKELARLLGVGVDLPESFEGIPTIPNQSSRFFAYSHERGEDDIDALWNVFAVAGDFADSGEPKQRGEFIRAYDAALEVRNVKVNLSIGLYWAHPYDFLSLDQYSLSYIEKCLLIRVPKEVSGENYVDLIDKLKDRFKDDCPVHSFPELAQAAYEAARAPDAADVATEVASGDVGDLNSVGDNSALKGYSVGDILADGCFLERDEIERLLALLTEKKNLILQGPPGTGKTWIATRLAFALMEKKDKSRICRLQFHPNLSYEDFVRGWRPFGDGKLVIEDGVFMQAVHQANESRSQKVVVVIEEINRGNPAQVFGELLTLLEADKRTSEAAVRLCYPDANGKREPVHVPDNLYVIGTMNTADRSLALIDFAFRRRFAFAALKPKLGDKWRKWVIEQRGIDGELARGIERRITELNQKISDDGQLGDQFRIGHSFVTPVRRLGVDETRGWFENVVRSEIGPQLDEYWFDSPERTREAIRRLLDGW